MCHSSSEIRFADEEVEGSANQEISPRRFPLPSERDDRPGRITRSAHRYVVNPQPVRSQSDQGQGSWNSHR